MIAHFAGIIFYLVNDWQTEFFHFRVAMQDRWYILFPGPVVVLYVAAQVFLWVRFLSAAGPQSGPGKIAEPPRADD